MSQVVAWFDRKFDFGLPLEHFPNVCIRLRGAPARLEDMLRGAQRHVLIKKPGEKWSAQEHAGHLLDLETLWRSRIEDLTGDGDRLPAADLTNRGTTEANHNAKDLSEILRGFRAERLRMLDQIDSFPPEMFGRSKLHPRLQQPMRLLDHLFFVAEHDDHHLARIWDMIQG